MSDSSTSTYNQPFRINGYIIDPLNNRIIHNGDETVIEQKMMDVLVCLAHRQEEIVTRDELMDFAWPEVYVTEETLTRCISLLRKSFEDHAHQPEIIKTVRNRGYQLITPVTFLEGEEVSEIRSNGKQFKSRATWIEENRSIVLGTAAVFCLLIFAGALLFNQSDPDLPVLPGHEMPFTALPGVELYPAFSPDDQLISFAWNGPNQNNWDIYMMKAGDGNPVRLTRSPESELGSAWSPDGTTIAFIRNGSGESGIYLIPSGGGPEQKIADRGITYRSSLAWSPDGRWIAFADSANTRASTGIFMVSPETGERRQLTEPSMQHWGDYDPSFSPDGNHLAFTSSVSMGNRAIYILNIETGEERRLTDDPLQIRGHTWSKNGKHIIFSSVFPEPEALWSVTVGSGKTTWLGKRGRYPSFANSKNTLAVEHRLLDSNLWKYSLDTESENDPPFNSTRVDRDPAYSPDGNKLVFISDRSGYNELWMVDLASDSLAKLTDFQGMSMAFPRWSPDERYISFNGFTRKGNADVFIYDFQTEEIIQLTSKSSNEVFPTWAPDSRTLFFGSNRSGVWHIWSKTLEADQVKKVTDANGYAGYISEDGSALYFTRYDIGGFWKQDLSKTSGAKRLVEMFQSPMPTEWQLVENNIYYLRQMDNPEEDFELVRYDPGSKDFSQIKRIDYQPGIESFALHPDLSRLILTKTDINRVDIHLFQK